MADKWSDFEPRTKVRWMTPVFVKAGIIVAKRGRSLKVQFEGELRPTVIPNARWYHEAALRRDPENSLVVLTKEASNPSAQPRGDHSEVVWIEEAASLHGLPQKRLRVLLRSGKVKGDKSQGRWRVDLVSLSRWMADRG